MPARTRRPRRGKSFPRQRLWQRFRPFLEELELRVAPAVVSWVQDADGFWDVGSNWSTGNAPQNGDDVVINRAGANPTVTYRQDGPAIHGLTTNNALVLSGGTLSINASSTLGGSFTLSGGQLTGSGDVSVIGNMTWTGGTMSGSGTTAIDVGGTLTLSGGNEKRLDGRALTNAGAVIWGGGGNVKANNGSSLVNLAGGLFDLQSDQVLFFDNGRNPTFDNQAGATLRKSAGSGTSSFQDVAFTNEGTVDAQSGRLVLGASYYGGGSVTSSGAFKAGGGFIDLVGNTHTFTDGATFTGSGAVIADGATVVINGTVTDQGNFQMADGTLTGAGNFVVQSPLSWTGGTMAGAGTTTVLAGQTLTLSGGNEKRLDGRTLTNVGTVAWGGGGNLKANNGAVLINQSGGLFDLQSDQALFFDNGRNPTFDNQAGAILRKSAGSGTSSFQDVAFTNEGTVDAQNGRLVLGASYYGGGSVTSSSAFQADAGALIDLVGSTHTFNTGATFTGTGLVRGNGATLVINAGQSAAVGTPAAAGTFELAGGSVTGAGTLTVSSTGTLNWDGGTMADGGKTAVAAGAALNLTGGNQKQLDGRTLTNAGTVTWGGSGNLRANNGSALVNLAGGLFDLQSDQTLYFDNGRNPTFDNQAGAILRKSAGTGTSSFQDVAFTNEGAVTIQTGTFTPGAAYYGGGSVTGQGSFNISSGAVLNLVGSTHTFSDGTTFNGPGHVQMNGPTVVINGTVTANTAFDFNSGTLQGSQAWTGSGAFNWASGTIAGSGTTTITSGFVLNLTGGSEKRLDGHTLVNAGTVTWGSSGNLKANNGSAVLNQAGGLFDLQSDQALFFDNGRNPTFDNQAGATLRKSSGSGTSSFQDVAFSNEGTVTVQTGTFTPGAAYYGGGSVTNNGTFNISSGAGLNLIGSTHNFNDGTVFNGPGHVQMNGPNVVLNGTVTVNTAFDFNSGTLQGTQTWTGSGVVNWAGGTIAGSGTTTIAAGFALNLTGNSEKRLDGHTVANAGTVVWAGGGNLKANNGSALVNQSGSLFDLQSDQALFFDNGRNPTFDNQAGATLRKSAGSGTSSFQDVVFSNSGTLDVRTGTFIPDASYYGGGGFQNFSGTTLTGGTYQVAGTLQFNNANIVTNAAGIVLDGPSARIVNQSGADGLQNFTTNAAAGSFTIQNGRNFSTAGTFTNNGTLTVGAGSTFTATGLANNQGATLAGTGTVQADVTSAGTVSPGVSGPGVLTITGNYTQTAAGALNIDIAGTTLGAEFDQLAISGTAALDGTLNVGLLGGYQPLAGDTFPVLTFGAHSGQFAVLNGLTLGGRQSFRAVYDPNDLTLLSVLAGVRLTPTSGLVTTEAGGTTQFTAVLTTQPTADVSFGLASSNPAAGTVSPTRLTFTPGNWNVPQTVTVTGVDDALIGDVPYSILPSVVSSGDPLYDGLQPNSVSVTNLDDDTRDLQVMNPGVTPTGLQSGSSLVVRWDDADVGNIAVTDSFTDTVLIENLTTGHTLASVSVPYDASAGGNGPIPANGSSPRQYAFTLPQGLDGAGQIRITVTTNADHGVIERNTAGTADGNNTASVTVTSLLVAPDLQVLNLGVTPATGLQSGASLTVHWDDTNTGGGATGGSWSDYVTIKNTTTGETLATAFVPYDATVSGALQPGGASTRQYSFTLPDGSRGVGQIEIIVTADANDQVFELNPTGTAEQNNSAVLDGVSTLAPYPDLQVANLRIDPASSLQSGGSLLVRWDDSNTGNVATAGSWYDYVSVQNTTTGETLTTVAVPYNASASGAIQPGVSSPRQFGFSIPAGTRGAGQFAVAVTTDYYNQVFEANAAGTAETNNTATLSGIPIVLSYADLVVDAVSAPSAAQSGDAITVRWRVRNQGNAATNVAAWTDRLVLSASPTLDASAVELAQVSHNGALAVGDNYTAQADVTLPNGIAGDFYVFVVTDTGGAVFESTFTANNAGRTLTPLTVALKPAPDLQVTAVAVPTAGEPGQQVTVVWSVSNAGPGLAAGPWVDQVYLSQDGTLNGATLLATVQRGADLASGAGYNASATFALPTVADGTYRLVVVTDAANAVYEGNNKANNLRASDTALQIGHPDLAPAISSAPTSATSGTVVPVSWTVSNAGSADALGAWVDRVYVSPNSTFDGTAVLLGELPHSGPLASGASYSGQLNVTLSLSVSGPRYFLVVTDATDQVTELAGESNNIASAAVQIAPAPYADLAVSGVTAPALTIGDPAPVTVGWTVTNQGNGISNVDTWTDAVIASTDTVVGNGDDVVLARFTHNGALAVGAGYTQSQTFFLPPAFEGRYHLLVLTDADTAVYENNLRANNAAEAGNSFDVSRTPYADLVVTSVSVPSAGSSGQPLQVSWTVKNQGIGLTDPGNWDDHVQLASDPAGTHVIADLGVFGHIGGLTPGDSYTRSVGAVLPDGLTGTVYVVVSTGGPYEFVHTDNNSLVSGPVQVTLTSPPDLDVTAVTAPATANSADTINISWTVRNDGPGDAAGPWVDTLALKLVGTGPTINLGSFTFANSLQAGKFYARSERFTLPDNIQGLYQVVVTTNATGTLYENSRGGNNTNSTQTVLISLTAHPDLQVQSITSPPRVTAGGTVSLAFTVINQGTVPTTTPHWQDKAYLSLDNKISADDLLIGTFDNGSALGPGESYQTQTGALTIPRRYKGQVFLIVKTNADGAVNEFPNGDNNTLAVPLDVIPLPPSDLVLSGVVAPDQVFAGSQVEVRYHVANQGAGTTDQDGWTDTIWLTHDRTRPDPRKGDILLASSGHSGALAVGDSYDQTVTVTIPATYRDRDGHEHPVGGNLFLTPFTDSYGTVTQETFSTNINPDDPNQLGNDNYKARPISILTAPSPDVVVTAVQAAPSAVGDQPFTVQWTVKNQGGIETTADTWRDEVYLSDRPDLGGGAHFLQLGSVPHSGALDIDQSYTAVQTFQLSPEAAGQFVIVRTEAKDADPARDILFAPTSVTPAAGADLRVSNVITQPQNFSGEITTVQWTVQNDGGPVRADTHFWTNQVYFSPDPTFLPKRATLLAEVVHSNAQPLGTGEGYTQSADVTLPRGIGGTFYIHVLADAGGTLHTGDASNDGSRSYFTGHGYEVGTHNLATAPVPVTYREADLQVTSVVPPSGTPSSGQTIPVTWTVTNAGTRKTREDGWIDRVYLSRDPSLSPTAQMLGEASHTGFLAPGGSYTTTLNVALPDGIQGSFYVLIFTDSNIVGPLPPGGPGVKGEDLIPPMARVDEYRGEGNNIAAAPLSVVLSTPPDLQVTAVNVPQHVTAGQAFDLTYTVTNAGQGDTPPRQSAWDDLFYLSSDPFLDLQSDRYLGTLRHTGGLAAGASYTATQTLKLPAGLTGPFYVFVVTDPVRFAEKPYGEVFEGGNETNNATASAVPMLIELPPPADLQVDAITVPGSAQAGDTMQIQWTVTNHGTNPASGTWSDAAYLSPGSTWNVSNPLLGRGSFTGTLAPGQSYTSTLQAKLPPVKPGTYRVIVRADVFNEVFEGADENNNTTASADAVRVTVPDLHLGVPLPTTLSSGQDRIFALDVPAGLTLRVGLTAGSGGANELFLRHEDVPNGTTFDAASQGPIQADTEALIPSTQAGTYYVLVRGQSEPAADTPVTLLAEALPFQITDVSADRGGDSRYVTVTIRGAQFDPQAIVKLVRPGLAEYEPVSYQVLDATRIVAVFDLRGAPHGLYDVKVINPGGQEAIVPYRYLVERALPPQVSVGLGGDRVLQAGDTGRYGFTLQNLGNVDLPYVYFQFGIPELGTNDEVFNLERVVFSSNLGGQPRGANTPGSPLAVVPWADLVSSVDAGGENIAPGYAVDLANGGFGGLSFTAQTYPGLKEIIDRDLAAFKAQVEKVYAQYRALLDQGDAGLAGISPDLPGLFDGTAPNPLDDIDPDDVAFRFHIEASATPLTRDEFLAQQRDQAAKLRSAILADPTASQSLVVLAADAKSWTDLYLTALGQAGLLRPADTPPEVHDDPQVFSVMSVLASGILAGPAGQQIITNGNLADFFAQVHRWYGDQPGTVGSRGAPSAESQDLHLSAPTTSEAFNIAVNFSNKRGAAITDLFGGPTAQQGFGPFFAGAAGQAHLASLTGPVGQGAQQFIPLDQPLPYTVRFTNPATASGAVGEVRVVTQLDPNLDPRTFRLGDLQLGDLQVHVPNGRGAFQGDFDFTRSKGFILRVSAGLDFQSNTASWLLQAIDPNTGGVVQDPARGLLLPNNVQGRGSGFVSYTVQPKDGLATGTPITAQARVLFNTLPPEDTPAVTDTIDGAAPTTTLTATPIQQGGSDYLVQWNAVDDAGGSGVKSVTVYVAEDCGDFTTWLSQTTDAQATYQGRPGHTYEFLALATDIAGNREQPTAGRLVPSNGATTSLGGLPTVGQTSTDLGPPATPSATPSTNPLFVQAQQGIPAAAQTTRPSEFQSVLQPFTASAFATGIPESESGIGPLAIVSLADGSVLASGGLTRGQLFRFGVEGGPAGAPLASLPFPVFGMALDPAGNLWATTGGGPLLQLDPATGNILGQYGDGLTQGLAVQPGTGLLYVTSGHGIEVFDPTRNTFRHYSDIRADGLAFAPDGALWATTWPKRGDVVRFDLAKPQTANHPQVMLRLAGGADSLAFGVKGSPLDGLLFVTSNDGELTLVDLATLQRVTVATGGTRGDVITATADGRILLSQSHQIDVFSPVLAPRVVATNPPADALAALPLGTIDVAFDHDMRATDPADPHSVLNAANYQLTGDVVGTVPVRSVTYDPSSRVATLGFDALVPDGYGLVVSTNLQSTDGVALGQAYSTHFTTVADLTAVVGLHFSNARMLRSQQTVSYDVLVTNSSSHDLLLPLVLELSPVQQFAGEPLGNQGRAADGSWLIDLSADLPNGLLRAGQSTVGQTITVRTAGGQRVAFNPSVTASPTPNAAPVFESTPLTDAAAGQPYAYTAVAQDVEDAALIYVIDQGPAGMTVDSASGLVTWSPTAASPARADVVLLAYDSEGAHARQEFTVQVAGTNGAPIFDPLDAQVQGQEGTPLAVTVGAADPEGDPLVYWADHLPPGAVFDPEQRTLRWTPGPGDAGSYDVHFVVSDGLHLVRTSTTLTVAPTNQPPVLAQPPDLTVNEGDPLRLQLQARDPEGQALTYSSTSLPGGATLDPQTGLFQWTPAYFQHGVYTIPFSVSDGTTATTQTTTVTVLNVNAPPAFDGLGAWQVQEGQQVRFRAFAFDPDNPSFVPQDRTANGTLTDLEGTPPTVTYTVSGLPPGATFDPVTAVFAWTPDFTQAGQYTVTFTGTDDGDGTDTPRSTTQSVPITILNTNRPPAVTAIVNQVVRRGDLLDVPLLALDPDGDPLVWSTTGLPSFATLVDHGDGTGVLRFAPGPGDRGSFPISVKASDDGDGGGPAAVLSGSQGFVLTVDVPNEAPVLDTIGDKVAVFGRPLTFTVRASDFDQDALSFTATGLPAGATLTPSSIYGTAIFSWTPTAADAGTHSLTFQVSDSGNGHPNLVADNRQTIRLVVRATDQAPVLAPIGNRTGAEGQALFLSLSAFDPDGDGLTYSASNLPPGATFDPVGGALRWTPIVGQAGSYPGIVLAVSDGIMASSETIRIDVSRTNHAPVLAPLTPQSGREGTPLQFTLSAADPDGDPVRYSAVSGLPAGARLDPTSGHFQWTPTFDQDGSYTIRFAAADPGGMTSTIDVAVAIANVNRPSVLHVSSHTVALGQPLSFMVQASDPDAEDTLTLAAAGLPDGATFDAHTGLFSWTPGPGQAGRYNVNLSVSDGQAVVSQTAEILAALRPEPPRVTVELTPSFPVVPGQAVLVHASAASLADITGLTLTVDGRPVALDAQGRATITAVAPGRMRVEATAANADGLTGHASAVVKVSDPNDTAAPVVAFDPHLTGARLTGGTDLVVSVSDSNLDSWVLEQAPLGSGVFTALASGTSPVAGAAARFDPLLVANGAYRLRLTAVDMSGRSSSTETIIEADAAAKPTQYLRSETDVTALLGGVPVALVRQYDSLTRDRSGSFGFGWRLANRDFAIETNVAPTGREAAGEYNPFRLGTRLYLTLPDGRRVGFTFAPERHQLPGVVYYTPAWQADPGVAYRLDSAAALLTLAGDRIYDLKTARPYNPASGLFQGPEYTLTAPDGTVYSLSTPRGALEQDTSGGVRLFFSDSGITSSTGETISFVHDAAGRLTSITGPDGSQVVYSYDAAGNLAAVERVAAGQATHYGYAKDDSHLLTLAVPSSGQGGAAIRYAPNPVVLPVVADLGSAARFTGAVQTGALTPGGVDRYVFSVRDSEVRSTASGTVLLGVVVQAAAGSAFLPAVPTVAGLTPLVGRAAGGGAFALFAIDRAGSGLLELAGRTGATAGAYTVRLVVAGDVNGDGLVDARDAQALTDLDGDGAVDPGDTQILGSNFGFTANRPPVVAAGSAHTHADLQVLVPVAGLATDPEGDPVTLHVVASQGGSAVLSPDGQSVLYQPAPGFTGQGSFQVVADDGYNSSAPATVAVDVSAAPLVDLDLVQRQPRLKRGEHTKLSVVGRFTDESDVPLPASYLTFTSTNATSAAVAPDGRLTAVADGWGAVVVASHGIQATTAFEVGQATGSADSALALLGLTAAPAAVTLVPQGGQRQLDVTNLLHGDRTTAASGTVYYVSNPAVIQVTPDGLIVAGQPGQAFVTAINEMAETRVPVLVQAPHQGPALLDDDGGAVQGPDGSVVTVAPGVLAAPTRVSITPLPQQAITLPLPTGFHLDSAFQLQLGDGRLGVPAQLAIPASAGLAVGTRVYFLRQTTVPDEQGNQRPIWLEDEVGEVGADGYVRTHSYPFRGVRNTDTWVVANADTRISIVRGVVTVSDYSNPVQQLFALAGALLGVSSDGPDEPFFFETYDISDLRVEAIPGLGLPTITEVSLQQQHDGSLSFQTLVNTPVSLAENPVIQSAQLAFDSQGAYVQLIGQFNPLTRVNNRQGNPVDQTVFVNFYGTSPLAIRQDPDPGSLQPTPDGREEMTVRLPATVPAGLARIEVVRQNSDGSGTPLRSKLVYLAENAPGHRVFAALRADNKVAAFDGSTLQPLVSIPVGMGAAPPLHGYDSPRDVAVTGDNTRAYVTLFSGAVAVVDTVALRELDTIPDQPNQATSLGVNPIILPDGAQPFWIVIDPLDRYAYVSDMRLPSIYVIDIQTNKYLKTIPLDKDNEGLAPRGLRGLAISNDGNRLYAAAPADFPFGDSKAQLGTGHIFVVNINPADQPQPGANNNDKHWQERIKVLNVGAEPYGISATPDPLHMIFANRGFDGQGFGIIDVTSNDPMQFDASVRYVPLNLGSQLDYFDVNNAQSVVITPDSRYAFVTGFDKYIPTVPSHDPNSGDIPGGGNVGIIADPLGPGARLVAATRPTPYSFPDNLVFSPDQTQLFAAYREVPVAVGNNHGAVFVFDVNQMIQTVQQTDPQTLATTPIDDINPAIDTRANYVITQADPVRGEYTFGVPPGGSATAPLVTAGFPQGLASQSDWLRLINPVGPQGLDPQTGQPTLTPTFSWAFGNVPVRKVSLYVSVFPRDEGLLPWDRPRTIPQGQDDKFLVNGDINPNRILTKTWIDDGSHPVPTSFLLPPERMLTASQVYYWAVQAVSVDGHTNLRYGSFRTASVPAADPQHFSAVTLITHGFQLPYLDRETPLDFVELAQLIAQTDGGSSSSTTRRPGSGKTISPRTTARRRRTPWVTPWSCSPTGRGIRPSMTRASRRGRPTPSSPAWCSSITTWGARCSRRRST